MKKKHRDIVVDGVTYGWIAMYSNVRIFENKVVIGSYTIPERLDITPSIVAALIKDPVLAMKWINAEPCPFCGKLVVPSQKTDYFLVIHEDDCWLSTGAEPMTSLHKSKLNSWNKRH